MNTKGFGTTSQHKAYCGKHSAQQKEEDAQRFGPEELRSMKRMRVYTRITRKLVSTCYPLSPSSRRHIKVLSFTAIAPAQDWEI
ncbi:hypothetical protein SETIT_7G005900v2 [Setaria italica]|uniref:Uncharacterized protein n=1 Tax=Setaria italica TaxID=4555 RepID=A0A368RQU0_SETIT|nr:hypothetical protein SETIT_7G005900v2 [Setaria italica]